LPVELFFSQGLLAVSFFNGSRLDTVDDVIAGRLNWRGIPVPLTHQFSVRWIPIYQRAKHFPMVIDQVLPEDEPFYTSYSWLNLPMIKMI